MAGNHAFLIGFTQACFPADGFDRSMDLEVAVRVATHRHTARKVAQPGREAA